MKLYDYSNLVKVIREVDLQAKKLANEKEMCEKNKLAELENELLNSGIIQDWHELSKFSERTYSRWESETLNDHYIRTNEFYEFHYLGGTHGIAFTMSYYYGHYHFGISLNKSYEANKIVWVNTHDWSFDAKTKIKIIEMLFRVYEEYRTYSLIKTNEAINEKLQKNEKVRREIASLL